MGMTEEEREWLTERRALAEERIREVPEEEKNAWLSAWFDGWAGYFLTGDIPEVAFPEEGRAEALLTEIGDEMAGLSSRPEEEREELTVLYEELFLQLYGCAQLPGAGRSVRSKEMAEAVYWFRHDNRRVLTGGEEEI